MIVPGRCPRLIALTALVVLGLAGGATAAVPGKVAVPTTPIIVFAASSLTDVLPAINQSETYSFAGSNTLATQIANGAPADVFASANTAIPASLYAQGLVEKPVSFTRNTLVIVVPKSNPAGINDIYDLAKPGVSIEIANDSVPVGSYTLSILKNMALTSTIIPNVVSQENDVRTVLTKIALGQADAGFVYATDVRPVLGKVGVIRIRESAQPHVVYEVAVVKTSRHLQAAYAYVTKQIGRASCRERV